MDLDYHYFYHNYYNCYHNYYNWYYLISIDYSRKVEVLGWLGVSSGLTNSPQLPEHPLLLSSKAQIMSFDWLPLLVDILVEFDKQIKKQIQL